VLTGAKLFIWKSAFNPGIKHRLQRTEEVLLAQSRQLLNLNQMLKQQILYRLNRSCIMPRMVFHFTYHVS
jgi:hypothetical protein